MRRRELLLLLGGAAIARPGAAFAQTTKSQTIGLLGAGSEKAWSPLIEAFRQRLQELNWAEGRNLAIVPRWANGESARYEAIAAEFVQAKVDVILTAGSAVAATKRATTTIPIVFAAAIDPVASGFVESLARPGGNVTGLSLQSNEIAPKRIEILREAFPGLSRLAVLANAGYPGAARESAAVQETAKRLGLSVTAPEIRRKEDLAPAIASLKGSVQALYVCIDSLIVANNHDINAAALDARLATLWGAREYVRSGGFLSYGPNEIDQFRMAADYVDKILRGTKPADIPVAQPTKIDLAINLQTAKTLGLTINEAFLFRADEVIE